LVQQEVQRNQERGCYRSHKTDTECLQDTKDKGEKEMSTQQTQKEFLKEGNYLIDEVKTRAEKGSPYFFSPNTMRGFSSRISELCWKVKDDIYFITSEADRFDHHKGSIRAYTIRTCDIEGDINTIGEFQGHATLRDARQGIKAILEKKNDCRR